MHIDYILIASGIFLCLAAVCGGFYLYASRKRAAPYKNALVDETQTLTALSQLTKTAAIKSAAPVSKTMPETANETELGIPPTVYDTNLTQTSLDMPDIAQNPAFNPLVLTDKYRILEEIHGGGMSRVFIAENIKLGNKWIIKYIDKTTGALSGEEHILKLLNHTNMPQIVDIFHDETGTYIAETYIEGIPLDKIITAEARLPLVTAAEWMEQLAQVLQYLHTREPAPILHLDLKPSNIMITPDYKPVLIDFGVSKLHSEGNIKLTGVTYKYAAPEQLKHNIDERQAGFLNARFGKLPGERINWPVDTRTDIYALGLIYYELLTGSPLYAADKHKLHDTVPREIADIVLKCTQTDPSARYASCAQLLQDITKVKNIKAIAARRHFTRRVISYMTAALFIGASGLLTGGVYIQTLENAAVLGVIPAFTTVSLQQSCALTVEKSMPDGNNTILDTERIRWEYTKDNIAQVDGGRVSGINLGETELTGYYRNKQISLTVRVVEPMDGMVDISQMYEKGRIASIFAGTNERERTDGPLNTADFVSPESIAQTASGDIYIADSGVLRRISGGYTETIDIQPRYMQPQLVRTYGDDVYILTKSWEDAADGGYYYAIIKLNGNSADVLYTGDARYTVIEDFAVSPDGYICFINHFNEYTGADMVYLYALNLRDPGDAAALAELPEGTSGLAMGDNGDIYLANPETGVIHIYTGGMLKYFAGIENERAFTDGTAPRFYSPQRPVYADGSLYIWDFNVIRRINIENGAPLMCITIAGEASPVFDLDIPQNTENAEDIILPYSRLADFTIHAGGGVLLTDPKRAVIWRIE